MTTIDQLYTDRDALRAENEKLWSFARIVRASFVADIENGEFQKRTDVTDAEKLTMTIRAMNAAEAVNQGFIGLGFPDLADLYPVTA